MKKLLFASAMILGLGAGLWACPASANYPYTVDSSVSACDPQAPANCIRPLLTAIAGTQRGLSIASATALTIPTGAKFALIQAQGTNNTSGVCLFWQDDGTAPTNAAGNALSANSIIAYAVQQLPIQLISASGATCTATISYYK